MTSGYIYAPDNSPYWGSFGLELAKGLGQLPSLWLSHHSKRPAIIDSHRDIAFKSFHHLNLGQFEMIDLGVRCLIDGPLYVPSLAELSSVVQSFDRYDTLGNLRLIDREALALKLFSMVSLFVSSSGIKTLVQVDSPHWPIEIVLDTVCSGWGVKRLTLKYVKPFGRCALFDGYDGAPIFPSLGAVRGPGKYFSSDDPEVRHCLEMLDGLRNDSGTDPGMALQDRSQSLTYRASRILEIGARTSRDMFAGSRVDSASQQAFGAQQVLSGGFVEGANVRWAPLDQSSRLRRKSMQVRRWAFQRRSLERLRDGLRMYATQPPDDLSKVVVFFLHFEPERTTLLEGGPEYWLQSRALMEVRESLPADLTLCVQEHSSYWNPSTYSRGYLGRTSLLYEAISALRGVHLVASSTFTRHDLLNVAGVVTVTGTVGIEGGLRGAPVLSLGFPWYRWVPGFVESSMAGFLERLDQNRLNQSRLAGMTPEVLDSFMSFVLSAPHLPRSGVGLPDDPASGQLMGCLVDEVLSALGTVRVEP